MNMCPVCGYNNLRYPPYDDEGNASDEICPCCRFQFGLNDYPYDEFRFDIDVIPYAEKEILFKQWRADWIQDGCPWFSKSRTPPEGWNAQEQLINLQSS